MLNRVKSIGDKLLLNISINDHVKLLHSYIQLYILVKVPLLRREKEEIEIEREEEREK